LQKTKSFTKRLKKSDAEIERDARVERTMEKLNSYKFVAEYLDRWEVEEQINCFIQSGEA
jgi:hypothetical protein